MSHVKPKKKTAKRKYRKPLGYDFTVLFIVLILVLFGVVMIFSSSYYYTMTTERFHNDMFYFLKRQSLWAVLGIAAMVGMSIFRIPSGDDLQSWHTGFPTVPLALPFVGTEAGGQKRWLGIGSHSFQPSEFTKIAVILFLSSYVIEHRKELANLKGFLKACCVLLLPVALIAISNFSSALLVGLMGATILFVASPRVWYFGAAIAGAIPLCGLAVAIPKFRYRLTRIKTWHDPWQTRRAMASRRFSRCMHWHPAAYSDLDWGRADRKPLFLRHITILSLRLSARNWELSGRRW